VRAFQEGKGDGALFALPAEGHEARRHAWPSPRSWFFATQAMNTCKALGEEAEKLFPTLLEGCIGSGLATEFIEFLSNIKLPDPRDVLSGKWKPVQKDGVHRLDISIAAYTQMVMFVTQGDSANLDPVKQAWLRLTEYFNSGGADLCLPLVQKMHVKFPETRKMKEAIPLLVAIGGSGLDKFLNRGE
jgi:hypothetical protein